MAMPFVQLSPFHMFLRLIICCVLRGFPSGRSVFYWSSVLTEQVHSVLVVCAERFGVIIRMAGCFDSFSFIIELRAAV
jgi:hypothetical protein